MPKLILFVMALLLSVTTARFGFAEEGDGISGLWLGTYTYTENSYKPSRFVLVLKKEDLAFSGKVLENNSFGDESAAYLSADVMGSIDDQGQVHFIQRYDGTGDQHHLVVCDGKMNEKKTVIVGKWAISDDWSGTFSMKLIEPYRRLEEAAGEPGAAPTAEVEAGGKPASATPVPSEQNF